MMDCALLVKSPDDASHMAKLEGGMRMRIGGCRSEGAEFRKMGIADEEASAIGSQHVESDVLAFVPSVVNDRVVLREGAIFHVLARNTNMSLLEAQASESQCFGSRPVDGDAHLHSFASFTQDTRKILTGRWIRD